MQHQWYLRRAFTMIFSVLLSVARVTFTNKKRHSHSWIQLPMHNPKVIGACRGSSCIRRQPKNQKANSVVAVYKHIHQQPKPYPNPPTSTLTRKNNCLNCLQFPLGPQKRILNRRRSFFFFIGSGQVQDYPQLLVYVNLKKDLVTVLLRPYP